MVNGLKNSVVERMKWTLMGDIDGYRNNRVTRKTSNMRSLEKCAGAQFGRVYSNPSVLADFGNERRSAFGPFAIFNSIRKSIARLGEYDFAHTR